MFSDLCRQLVTVSNSSIIDKDNTVTIENDQDVLLNQGEGIWRNETAFVAGSFVVST